MNTSRVDSGQLIAAIGGIVLIISLFLTWLSAPFGFPSQSAFDAFSAMDIVMLIVGVLAIVVAVATAIDAVAGLPANTGWILALLGVAMVGWTVGFDLEQSNAGFGAWLALAASIAIAYGGLEGARLPDVSPGRATTAGRGGTAGGSGPAGPAGSPRTRGPGGTVGRGPDDTVGRGPGGTVGRGRGGRAGPPSL